MTGRIAPRSWPGRRAPPKARAWLVAVLLLAPGARGAEQVGEVVFTRGAVSAQTGDASPRLLGAGEPVYRSDVITSTRGTFGVLRLKDDTRVALRPDTVLQIEEFSVEPSRERGVLSLFKGGLRAITGFVSKRRPGAVEVRTSVATIGIRGTKFDARLCAAGECGGDEGVAGEVLQRAGRVAAHYQGEAPRPLRAGDWLFPGDTVATGPCAGAVLALADGRRVHLGPGRRWPVPAASGGAFRARMAGAALPPGGVLLPVAGRRALEERVLQSLYAGMLLVGAAGAGAAAPGLYVACYEGNCSVTNPEGTVDLGPGQAAFAGLAGVPPASLPQIPAFQAQDPYFPAVEPEFENTLELFDEQGEGEGVDCIVQ